MGEEPQRDAPGDGMFQVFPVGGFPHKGVTPTGSGLTRTTTREDEYEELLLVVTNKQSFDSKRRLE